MSVDRLTRVNALLRREIGEALFRVLNTDQVDLASVTITRVSVSSSLRQAHVGVSILGHEHERGRILHRLRQAAPELQSMINRDLNLKYTPRLFFELDTSIERGDHVLQILSELDPSAKDTPDNPDNQTP
jgi:ribosome-binding factor A